MEQDANFEEALEYHRRAPAGKIAIYPTKPSATPADLSLAYSPGVAEPCRAIDARDGAVYEYTAKGNLVGVITNGTAVLGLGNIGPHAAKPVMEGKAILFRKFGGIDAFDLELDAPDVDSFCAAVRAVAPTFGGINLEDIKAPECFEIERRLKAELDIPVFHDDQHGTAVIAAAGMLNALELQGKSASNVRFVFSGAGAAALAIARLMGSLGVEREQITLVDSRGVVERGDPRLEGFPDKAEFASEPGSAKTLSDAVRGADVFVGVSVGGLLTPAMLDSMARKPVVFALSNPEPEIDYDLARAARADAICATGRSDFPNQVNNLLGFPSLFRAALDCRARGIDDRMLIAAARALAALAREPMEPAMADLYGREFSFGPEYVIPKPFDSRVLLRVAPAVVAAAVESGLARCAVGDDQEYLASLVRRVPPGGGWSPEASRGSGG